jgi:hypothetical protein
MSLLLGKRVWILLLTYCLFFSCKIKTGDNEVSGLVQPDGERQSTFYKDDFELKTATVLYDTITSNVSQRLLLGQYEDAVFGKVSANAYAQFVISNPFLTFGPNPILDSTLLIVSFSSTLPQTTAYQYGESNFPKEVSIYNLSQSIIDTTYLTKSSIPYNSSLLGVLRFIVQPASASVTLDNLLGQEFIDGVANFSSSEAFKAMFKGLALITKSSNCIFGIENMRILLKFHNYYGLNNLVVNDSLSIYLNGSPKFSFSNIKLQTEKSTVLSKLQKAYDTLSSDETQGICYIQANTGIGTKIKLPIDDFRQTVKGKILIDRADLVIKPDIGTNLDGTSSALPPPPYLMAYELDILGHVQTIITAAGISIFLQSETSAGILGSSRPLVVPYNNGEYRITMTSYIQALIDKNINKSNHGLLFIGSNDIHAGSTTNYYYSNINKVTIKSSDIKLQVHYSEYK